MQNGHCPKCQSTEIYRGTPIAGEAMHLAAFPTPDSLVTIYANAYVCINCGYIEMHVMDRDKGKLNALAKDTKNWQKAG